MASIAELDDEEGLVYFIGIDFSGFTEEDISSLLESISKRFDKAEFIILDGDLDANIAVSEIPKEDIREIIDYNDVISDVRPDDDLDYGVRD